MPKILVIMGSKSDVEVGRNIMGVLERFGVTASLLVASAHRTPQRVCDLVRESDAKVFIAVAGLSAALPGAVAAATIRPVIGVPVSGKVNLDSILSIVQMPPGIPVGTVGLDRGENAALLAVEILAIEDDELAGRLREYREEMALTVVQDSKEVEY